MRNNGGATETRALLAGSPAIDRGGAAIGGQTDQRGSPRFVDIAAAPNLPGANNSDIGAFEVQLAPTAASVQVGGRVATETRQGVRNAQVILIDSLGNSQTVMTTTFGYFRFANVQVGETYVVLPRSKRFRFAPQIVTVNEIIENLTLIASPNEN